MDVMVLKFLLDDFHFNLIRGCLLLEALSVQRFFLRLFLSLLGKFLLGEWLCFILGVKRKDSQEG